MFKKEINERNNSTTIEVKNPAKGYAMTVVPDAGAYINSLILEGIETIDGVTNSRDILKNPEFKSTLLAPFPNRIKDGKYTFDGKSYQLEINEAPRNNALHGLIFKAPFRLIRELLTEETAELEFLYDYDGSAKGYPFKFSTTVIYKIDTRKGFSANLKFVNHAQQSIPFGFGWHPYFTLNQPVDHLSLKTVSLRRFEVDQQMIPNGKTSEANEFTRTLSLKDIQLDDCFSISSTGDTITTELSDGAGVTLNLWQETGEKKLNYLQIYIPPHRQSIAIEPQTCCIDAFNNKSGYFELTPGEKISAALGVQVFKK